MRTALATPRLAYSNLGYRHGFNGAEATPPEDEKLRDAYMRSYRNGKTARLRAQAEGAITTTKGTD